MDRDSFNSKPPTIGRESDGSFPGNHGGVPRSQSNIPNPQGFPYSGLATSGNGGPSNLQKSSDAPLNSLDRLSPKSRLTSSSLVLEDGNSSSSGPSQPSRAPLPHANPVEHAFTSLGNEKFDLPFTTPEVVLNKTQVSSSVEKIERILTCLKTYLTIADYHTFASYDLADALRDYAGEVNNRKSPDALERKLREIEANDGKHLHRSKCISDASHFWENNAFMNDRLRLLVMRQFFGLNISAFTSFDLQAKGEMKGDMKAEKDSKDNGESNPVVVDDLPGVRHDNSAVPQNRGGMADSRLREGLGKCPFPLSSLPASGFPSPDPITYTKTVAIIKEALSAANSDERGSPFDEEKNQRRIDRSFRNFEEEFLMGFVVRSSLEGYEHLMNAFLSNKEKDLLDPMSSNPKSSPPQGSREDHRPDHGHSSQGNGNNMEDTRRGTNRSPPQERKKYAGSGTNRNLPQGRDVPHRDRLPTLEKPTDADEILADLIGRVNNVKRQHGCSEFVPFPASIMSLMKSSGPSGPTQGYSQSQGLSQLPTSTDPTSGPSQVYSKSQGLSRLPKSTDPTSTEETPKTKKRSYEQLPQSEFGKQWIKSRTVSIVDDTYPRNVPNNEGVSTTGKEIGVNGNVAVGVLPIDKMDKTAVDKMDKTAVDKMDKTAFEKVMPLVQPGQMPSELTKLMGRIAGLGATCHEAPSLHKWLGSLPNEMTEQEVPWLTTRKKNIQKDNQTVENSPFNKKLTKEGSIMGNFRTGIKTDSAGTILDETHGYPRMTGKIPGSTLKRTGKFCVGDGTDYWVAPNMKKYQK